MLLHRRAKKTQQCRYCKLMFDPRGISGHERGHEVALKAAGVSLRKARRRPYAPDVVKPVAPVVAVAKTTATQVPGEKWIVASFQKEGEQLGPEIIGSTVGLNSALSRLLQELDAVVARKQKIEDAIALLRELKGGTD